MITKEAQTIEAQFDPKKLREAREEKGLTQTELAQILGGSVSKGHISNYEIGYAIPTLSTLKKITEALEKPSMDWFLTSAPKGFFFKRKSSTML